MILNKRGFTLIEIIIAITLGSVVVTILAWGLRLGVNAYTRLKEENAVLIKISAVDQLLARQLRATYTDERNEFAYFSGDSNSVSFVTPHVPYGSRWRGYHKVCYLHDQKNKTLIYMQRVITRYEDLKRECQAKAEDTEGISDDGWEYTILENVERFNLRFLSLINTQKGGELLLKWDDFHKIPDVLILDWELRGDGERIYNSEKVIIVNPLLFRNY